MNAKLCKQLRRVAAGLTKTPVTERRYERAKHAPRTVILHPGCGRAAYRRLKKEVRG